MIAYLDTSAAMKLLVTERESEALTSFLTTSLDPTDDVLAASWLLHTELHCAANRNSRDLDPATVDELLDVVTLVDLTRGDLLTAGALPGRLRSNDAIHLAVALRIGVDALIAYDGELLAAAAAAGLATVSPR